MVVYELHVGALGYGKPSPGTLADALAYLDHLVETASVFSASDQSPLSRPAKRDLRLPEMSDRAIVAHDDPEPQVYQSKCG